MGPLFSARVLSGVLVISVLSALGAFLAASCKPRYALCESSSECAPNVCVAGRCVPGSAASDGGLSTLFGSLGVKERDAGRLAISQSERFILRPSEIAWSGGAVAGRFRSGADQLRMRFLPWQYPYSSDGGATHARVEEAYLLLHRAEGGPTDRVALRVGRSTVVGDDSLSVDVGDVHSPRPLYAASGEVRVDALSPAWVRLDAIPPLRGNSLKSGLELTVAVSDAAGAGVAFYVQSLSDVGIAGDTELSSPALELYVTTETNHDAGAANGSSDASDGRNAPAAKKPMK